MIYLDHNATTPLDPAVAERMFAVLRDEFGNPSSVHTPGQRARGLLDDARERIATHLACSPKELVFTSGGTEANNLALRGVFQARKLLWNRIVVSAVEHPSVLQTARALEAEGAEVLHLPVDETGLVQMDALDRTLENGAALVSVMWVNNETGVVQPVEAIAERCSAAGVPLHVDAVQAVGRLPIALDRLPIALLSMSAHKFHGPKGVGALFVRTGTPIGATTTGGHQERGLRPGTENVAGIIGLAEALDLAERRRSEDAPRVAALRKRLEDGLRTALPEAVIVGNDSERVPNTTCACFPGYESEALLMGLDLAGITASAGSACSSGSIEPSHVLLAQGIEPRLARGAVRFSLGRDNTETEIDTVISRVSTLLDSLSRFEPASTG